MSATAHAVSPEQLRGKLDELLAAAARGETFDIVRDGRLLARLGPPPAPALPVGEAGPGSPAVEWPDYAERRRRIFGDRVTPDSQPILDFMRADAGSPERGTDESVFPFPGELSPKLDPQH